MIVLSVFTTNKSRTRLKFQFYFYFFFAFLFLFFFRHLIILIHVYTSYYLNNFYFFRWARVLYILRHFRLTFQMFLLKKKERKYFLINFGDALTGCPRAGQGELWSNLCWHTERQRQQINRLTTYKLRIIDLIIYWHKNIYLVIFLSIKNVNKIHIYFFSRRFYIIFLL